MQKKKCLFFVECSLDKQNRSYQYRLNELLTNKEELNYFLLYFKTVSFINHKKRLIYYLNKVSNPLSFIKFKLKKPYFNEKIRKNVTKMITTYKLIIICKRTVQNVFFTLTN